MNNLNIFSLAVASHRLTPTKIGLESSMSGPIYD